MVLSILIVAVLLLAIGFCASALILRGACSIHNSILAVATSERPVRVPELRVAVVIVVVSFVIAGRGWRDPLFRRIPGIPGYRPQRVFLAHRAHHCLYHWLFDPRGPSVHGIARLIRQGRLPCDDRVLDLGDYRLAQRGRDQRTFTVRAVLA